LVWCSGGAAAAAGAEASLGVRKIAGDLVLANGEDDDFVGHAARASDVNCTGSPEVLSFLSICDRRRRASWCTWIFWDRSVEIDLDGADALRILGSLDAEFVVVAVAAALEVFEVVVIARDEAVITPMSPWCFRAWPWWLRDRCGVSAMSFLAPPTSVATAPIFSLLRFARGDLAGELLVGGDLILADGSARLLALRDFGSGHADFLAGVTSTMLLSFQRGRVLA